MGVWASVWLCGQGPGCRLGSTHQPVNEMVTTSRAPLGTQGVGGNFFGEDGFYF